MKFKHRPNIEQKEQKPADDKAFEEWIDDWWKHNRVNNPDSYDKGDEIQFDEQGFKNFCRRIRNMYQQKQVWSEEDEWVIEELCCLVDSYELEEQQPEKIKLWLKSLPERLILQPKQEWSKEDEKAIERAIDCVRAWEVDYCDGDNTISERLKSLRSQSHLKLDKKQKTALWNAIGFIQHRVGLRDERNGSINGMDYPDMLKLLESLYDDLKKL